MDIDLRITELERQLANLIRLGTVYAADYQAARVRVKSGDMTTGWLPWLTRRALGDRDWWAPEVGEQVVLFSPCGDPAQGVVLPAINQTAAPAPASDQNISRVVFGDGTTIEYNRTTHTLLVACVGDLQADVAGNTTVNVVGDLSATAAGTATIYSDGQATLKSSVKVQIEAPAVGISGAGGVASQGTMKGDFTLEGNINVTGNISATGTIMDGTGNSNHHIH